MSGLAGKRVIVTGAGQALPFITGAAVAIDGGALAWHGVRSQH